MKNKVNTDSDLVERIYGTDIGKLIFEGMMTIFIVLIFMFIAQNWVLTNVDDDTPFTPTCSLTDDRAGVSMSVSYETNKIMDGYKIRFDNM
jgi:hypothetical protein